MYLPTGLWKVDYISLKGYNLIIELSDDSGMYRGHSILIPLIEFNPSNLGYSGDF